MRTLEQILDGYLTTYEYDAAAKVLQQFYTIAEDPDTPGWKRSLIYTGLEAAGSAQRVARIGRALEESLCDFEEIRNYIVLLRPNAIAPLVDLLGHMQQAVTRKKLCSALAELGKDSVERFFPFLGSPRWFLVRNTCYILGLIANERAVAELAKAYRHEDPRVRREVIVALKLINSPAALNTFATALTDTDSYLRSIAAVAYGRLGGRESLSKLLECVRARDFADREHWEIEAFFRGIGMVGSNIPVPTLKLMLNHRNMFHRQRALKIRVGAAIALALIPTAEARIVLEAGLRSRDTDIRTACEQANYAQITHFTQEALAR